MYNKINIVVIDSGLDKECHNLQEMTYTEYNDVTDDIGHGTAILSILYSKIKNAHFHIYKLFSGKYTTNISDLINALLYIEKQCPDANIIHLSHGCVFCPAEEERLLYNICSNLIKKKIIVIAAFDNEGAISYPAAFDNVIGVDWSKSCNSPLEYVYVENSIVNILGVGSELRLPWLNNSYKYVSGSSFAAPFITTKIADLYQKGCTQLNDILKALKNDASRIVENISPSGKSSCYKINKAIAFPLNKEMHSVLAYSEMVDFEIVGIFDTKYSRNINVKLKDILINATSEMIVENYQNIDWEKEFDTVILGHLSPLSKVLKKNLFDEVITMCLKYKKNVYSFDNKHITQKIEDEFRDKNLKLFYPCYNEKSLSRNNLNKLYRFSTPSIAIMGTSPKQGKFTLQMEMLKYIKDLGYSVGHFCTEPTGWLLGSDVTFPIGFDSTIHLCGDDRIQAINGLMKDIERKQCDIIIIGSQSHTIPHNFGNLGFYPLSSLDLLLGCEPDVVVLCINPYDEIEYINRTIGFIESYTNSKVLALCMFPLKRQRIFSLHGNYTKTIEHRELLDIAYEYREQCNRQVFILGNKEEQNYLFKKCIDFFSE